ncbi:/ / ECF-type riboflavin transporter, S component / 468773:469639 Reverse [Candidatus Hepatoplasma crinochetorum]|uniref:/ / ECF-type riboflavin transporter, S component / 468773:469639 Reverse n=1 Tax=Candidatus Hepatoplasma crinochetorum TaxID=295596 RepID=A0A0G7ZLC4_9MOLU|nr:/ / ECF-type riboflavin transporter, S component / 468773:469639 Reverse [Candidatus Hepatoplasma crinochetorum]
MDTNYTLIWWILFLSFSFIIIFALIYYFILYKKEGRKALTIYKIPIFAFFYGIFLLQAFLTRIIPQAGDFIPLSFDDATIVATGILFGPIEAIVYGAIADLSRTLLNGWVPLPLPFLIFPFTGLIAGILGESYRNKKKELSIKTQFWIFQIALLSFLAICFILVYFLGRTGEEENFLKSSLLILVIISPIFVILLEFLFFYIYKYKKENLSLLVYLTLIFIIVRIFTGFIIRPYSQFYAFDIPFKLEFYERVFSSTYLVPSKIFVTFLFIISCSYAIKLKMENNGYLN